MKKKIISLSLILFFLLISCKPPQPPPQIEVEVCSESALLPSVFCLETEIRQYEQGSEPTELCDIHKAPEPGPSWLGTSCYQAIVFPLEDVEWFIKNIAINGGNATEFFLTFVWPVKNTKPYASYAYSGWKFQPYKIVCHEADPDRYGDYQFPISDLNKFHKDIWNKWREIFKICKKYSVTPFIRIIDYCSVKEPFNKRHYALNRNIQKGFCGHKKTLTGGMWGEPIKAYYSSLNKKLIDTLKEAGVYEYFLVPMNEADVLNGGWPGGEEQRDERCIDFHKFYIEDLQKWGCPKDQIIICTSRAYDELKELGCVMEIHGVNSDTTLRKKIETFGTENILYDGDGPDSEARGRPGDKPYKREPSVEQGTEIGRIVKENNLFGYIYFNRNIEYGTPDIRRAMFDVLKAIVEGVK